jgi:LmbE family N-acetylglucosaminyl deacetylase
MGSIFFGSRTTASVRTSNGGDQALRKVLETQTPDFIYLPHLGESHPDHGAALPLVRTALVQVCGRAEIPELCGYEVWSPLGCPDWTEDISQVMGQKLRAVRCYRSQLKSFRYDRAIRGLIQYRGVLAAGSRFAKVFRYLDTGFPNHE